MAAEVIESYPDEGGSRTPLGLRNRPWHVLSGRLAPGSMSWPRRGCGR
jgi:hypothetical protein